MAEGFFRRLLGNRKDIEVASAGVHAVRGQPPSMHAVHVCEQEGVDIRGLRSQPLTATLVDRATHIFAMTGGHLDTIHMLFPHGAEKAYLLREFEEPGMTVWRDVPDPIGCSRDVYSVCAATIKNALPTVLAFVEQSELAVPAKSRGGGTSSYTMADQPPDIPTSSPAPAPIAPPSGGLRKVDPEIFAAVVAEEKRQRENIELIASENFTSRAVMEAQGSVLTNKYAEGYPGKRWYGGCENVDTVEQLAIDRAKQLFGAEHVNVQPHSGAQANMAVYFAAIKPGDKILTMNLAHGGHLTHGHPANFSGKFYQVTHYGVDATDRANRLRRPGQTGRRSSSGDDHRGRLGLSENPRLSAAPENCRLSRRASFYRHGAHRRPGRGRPASDADPARSICHDDDA